jgi:hypothetical protein
MAKPLPNSNSAMEKLVESFLELRAEAKERMSAEGFREAEQNFDKLVRKIRARRRRKTQS